MAKATGYPLRAHAAEGRLAHRIIDVLTGLARRSSPTSAFFLAAAMLLATASSAAHAQHVPPTPTPTAASESARATLRAIRITEPPIIDEIGRASCRERV